MYKADQIANWFICRDDKNTDSDGISNLKIQKLLYYAQGASLALYDELLFMDELVAWEHGPVVVDLYHKYKEYGSAPIPANDIDVSGIDNDVADLLEDVYKFFGQYSAWKLRNMTHEEEPWKKTNSGETIQIELIKQSFMDNYVEESEN